MEIEVSVNGSSQLLASGSTVADLALQHGVLDRGGVAVAVNDSVVRRGEWPIRVLERGDRVLIITAAQGG